MQERIAFYEDMKAYNQLFELLSGGLFRFTYSLVKSNEVAEEIVSDVFIKVWQIRDRLPEIENLKVYLYTIAKNFSLNYLTKHYKNTVVSLDELDVEAVIELNGPAEMCISADLIQQIRRIIRQLPQQCQLIFQLVKEDGLKYKEVAAVLDELERVLVDISHEPSEMSSKSLENLQHRLESDGILFKIRVLGTNVKKQTEPAGSVGRPSDRQKL